jgi:hypothetical protein
MKDTTTCTILVKKIKCIFDNCFENIYYIGKKLNYQDSKMQEFSIHC